MIPEQALRIVIAHFTHDVRDATKQMTIAALGTLNTTLHHDAFSSQASQAFRATRDMDAWLRTSDETETLHTSLELGAGMRHPWFPDTLERVLWKAASRADSRLARYAVACGAHINAKDPYGKPALFLALEGVLAREEPGDTTGILATLLDLGASPDIYVAVTRSIWVTPLMFAASHPTNNRDAVRDIVRVLLTHSTDLDLEDSYGRTALMHAIEHGDLECIKDFLHAGASVCVKDVNGETPLHYAYNYREDDDHMEEIMRLLVTFGGHIDAVDHEGHTVLHVAVDHENTDAVRILLALGASVETASPKGDTLLSMAVRHGNDELVALLRAHRAPIRGTPSRLLNATVRTLRV